MKKCFSVAVVVFSACQEFAEEDPLSQLPVEQAPVMLDDAPNWGPLLSFSGSPTHDPAMVYGRATGNFTPSRRCTGFLADDDIFITADHCDGATTAPVRFGMYGPTAGDYSTGQEDARVRLRAIGVPSAVVAGLPWDTFSRFQCTWEKQDVEDRDVAYWRCAPNRITWSEAGQTIFYDLMPGHVYGHYDISLGTRGEGVDANVISINRRCGANALETLFSPGEVTDRYDSCDLNYEHCFEIEADWVGGSSGAPIYQESTFQVFGVVSRSWATFGDGDDPCDSHYWGWNYGAYIGGGIDSYRADTKNGAPLGAWTTDTAHVGGDGGLDFDLSCPGRTLGAGIVGTTSRIGSVGNLGLVCTTVHPASRISLDRAHVLSGGSEDVGYVVAAPTDMNTYLAQVLSSEMPGLGEQTLVMCPPGYLLKGISSRADNFVQRVGYITCENPTTGAQTTRHVTNVAGLSRRIGENEVGAWETASCGAGAYFAGLEVNAGAWTDGFRGKCRFD